jgi:hypothetical protein
MAEDYENAITKRLNRKKKEMGPSQHLPRISGEMVSPAKRGNSKEIQMEDEARRELAQVASQRRAYEIVRFYHT